MRKQDITYQDKLNELKLDIIHPNNSGTVFVLLEGQSDIRLFRKLFNLDKCKVETIPGGNPKLEECVNLLTKTNPLILGIRDADFIHLSDRHYNKTNMFLTDYHDMEIMLIAENDVFSSIIYEYSKLPVNRHSELRDNIMKTIDQISLLRWLNEKEHLGYKIEAGFYDLISVVNLEINFDQYFSRVLSKSPNATLVDISIVIQKLLELRETRPNAFQLCNGHDFMKSLSKYISEAGEGRTVGEDNISSSLRMAYSFSHYKLTKLYIDTKLWSENNNCDIYIS